MVIAGRIKKAEELQREKESVGKWEGKNKGPIHDWEGTHVDQL